MDKEERVFAATDEAPCEDAAPGVQVRPRYIRHLRDDDEPQTMGDALAVGTVEIWLDGEKLRGGYTLLRSARHGTY